MSSCLNRMGRITPLLAVAVALVSGCGGGSSSQETSPTDPSFGEFAFRAQEKAHDAAQNEPRLGSVTQSSNADGSGVTTDRIAATVRFASPNNVVYRIRNARTGRYIDTSERSTEVLASVFDPPSGVRAGAVLKESSDGIILVAVYTDLEESRNGQSDTDYLAGGLWIWIPDDARELDDATFAAFMDGNDPFRAGNLDALEGQAEYAGLVSGLYLGTAIDQETIGALGGQIALTADFDAQNANRVGTIDGRIHDIEDETGPVRGLGLRLHEADITEVDGGFFKGRTSTEFLGVNFSGRWGGSFYGNNDPSGMPGSVAGTFGAANDEETVSLLGFFGAYKQ